MAIYSCSARNISRKEGRSSTASAAYRSGTQIVDERTGVLWDFRWKGGVLSSELLLPADAPEWAADRSALWNALERREDKSTHRNDAKLARDFILALPHELPPETRQRIAKEFGQFLSDRYHTAIDIAMHSPDKKGDNRNFHAHVMMPTRALGPEGFGAKLRILDVPRTSGPELKILRKAWEDMANGALKEAGLDIRIDAASFEDLGKDQEATVHLGPFATLLERDGEATERGDINREITARNARRQELKAEAAKIDAQIIDLDRERAKREEAKAVRAEAKTLDPDRILASLTERRATFTRHDLNKALTEFLPDPKGRGAYTDAILGREDVVPLREDESAPVSRYTTREVLAGEGGILTNAATLNAGRRHGVSERGIQAALDAFPKLDPEQRAALDHATRSNGFAMIAGEAGTGKTYTLGAIRTAYEAEGYRVIGMSWKNDVVQALKADGFEDASTIKAELMRQNNARARKWNSRTVLMIDEAAMLDSPHMGQVLQKAVEAGAKIIPVGDGPQLGSIERGGMWDPLIQKFGAAELHTVRRVGNDTEQASAYNAMHRGDFKTALEVFDRRGGLHWSADPEASQAALVAAWAKDTAADPTKKIFALAATNAEVDALNLSLRAVRKERGELGEDHTFKTSTGEQIFAVNDRVVLTKNGKTVADRNAGFYNGAAGTVTGIDDAGRMTVTLDAGGTPAAPKKISFTVGADEDAGEYGGLKHYLAGTVFKAQGRTVDQIFALHSDQWRSSSTSYVALSRHRERVDIFAAEKASPWMMAQGGLSSLTDKQRASAEESYAAWAEAKPDFAQRYGIADYVDYVQAHWEKEKQLAPLDRLAQQMGRIEERRAASEFVQGPRPVLEHPVSSITDHLEPAADEVTRRRRPPLSIVAQIVGDYLELCYNPAKDVLKWITEDLKHRAAERRDRLFNNKGGEHEQQEGTRSGVGKPDGVRDEILRELQTRMGPDGGERGASGVPSGPGTDLAGDDPLRQVRTEDADAITPQDPREDLAATAETAEPPTDESASDFIRRRIREAQDELTERGAGPDRADDAARDRSRGRGKSFGRE